MLRLRSAQAVVLQTVSSSRNSGSHFLGLAVSAHRILDEAELDYKKKAEVVDKLAAVLILQSFMDYLENKPEEKTALLEEINGREG